MRGLGRISALLILCGIILTGCNKKIVPGNIRKGEDISFDSTAFDYVYLEALKQKLLGNAGDALKYFEQCIKINPKSDAAYYEIAQIAFQGGDLENAKKYALKSIQVNERNVWYLTLLASIYYQEKSIDSAIIYYEKAVAYFPEKANLKLTLGNFYMEKENYRKANEVFTFLEKKYGPSENISLFLIRSLMNSGDLKRAEDKIISLLKDYPDEILYNGLLAEIYRAEGEKSKAIEVYKDLMKRDQDNPQTLLSFSDFLVTEKEYNELFNLLNLIILNTNIRREDKISLFARFLENDDLIKTRGNELEMIILVLEATYKNDDIINLIRPELYKKQQKTPEAINRLEDLIELNPDNYYAWENVLLLYSETGDYNKLFTKGKECATKFNMSFIAKILYASAALEKNSYDIALEELRKAKILAGDNKEMQVQVMTMEADLYYRKKEFVKSYETFKEALKLSPENIIILNNYAYYLAEQGKELKEAERMARIVVGKENKNGTYLDTYAWVLYKRGRVKEAAKIMEEIIKNGDAADAEWCEHYGFMMKALRKCDKAVEYWKKAESLDSRKIYLDKEIQNCIK